MIKELQLLSEALWEGIKVDLKLFGAIQIFVKRLAETDFSDEENIKEVILYAEKIEAFFKSYRGRTTQPQSVSTNQRTARRIFEISQQLNSMPQDELIKLLDNAKPMQKYKSSGAGKIFIGHGRSKLWARLQLFLQDNLKINTLTFETNSHASESIVNILDEFLNESSFAILIMTAEDETIDGKVRARQNVIHEAGLFQGRLGFDKVIILKQEETEEFTNISGLQYISFSKDNIEQCFYELQKKLKQSGIAK